jgi:mono/diheme cytochrome c family protein
VIRASTAVAVLASFVAACVAVSTRAGDDVAPGASKDETPWANAPEPARKRANPYASQPDAVRAGRKLFARHCSECHGGQGAGGRNAPPLDTGTVQDASDGELFWMLTNGHLEAGMPSWSNLPEPRRWQIVSYLKTLEAGHTAR